MNEHIIKKVKIWRAEALKKVQQCRYKRKRIELAREYLEIDQTGIPEMDWPEMREIANQELRNSDKSQAKRDNLIKARVTCQRVVTYKEAWLPTLEEFRTEHPFDPWDDLTKPHKNQALKNK